MSASVGSTRRLQSSPGMTHETTETSCLGPCVVSLLPCATRSGSRSSTSHSPKGRRKSAVRPAAHRRSGYPSLNRSTAVRSPDWPRLRRSGPCRWLGQGPSSSRQSFRTGTVFIPDARVRKICTHGIPFAGSSDRTSLCPDWVAAPVGTVRDFPSMSHFETVTVSPGQVDDQRGPACRVLMPASHRFRAHRTGPCIRQTAHPVAAGRPRRPNGH